MCILHSLPSGDEGPCKRARAIWAGHFGVQGACGEGQAKGGTELDYKAWVLVLGTLALSRVVLIAGVTFLCLPGVPSPSWCCPELPPQ